MDYVLEIIGKIEKPLILLFFRENVGKERKETETFKFLLFYSNIGLEYMYASEKQLKF